MRLGTLLAALAVLSLGGCGEKREAYFDAPLFEEDAFTLAANILAQAGTRGCGEFKVVSQAAPLHRIRVACNDGSKTTERDLYYWPEFKVGQRNVVENAWDATWLSEVYCVKDTGVRWDGSYLNVDDARKRAIERSEQLGEPTLFYASNSLLFWRTFRTDDGRWTVNVPAGEVQNRDDRAGCELEKSPL